MLTIFLKGFLMGLAIAAPVGPIGILCIQRSLHQGFKIGFMTGMGAAIADGTYGLIVGFGFTALSSMLIAQQYWIRIAGGLFLIYLGIRLLLTRSNSTSVMNNSKNSSYHAFITTYFLTLTNPMTILSFIAILAGLGLGTNTDYKHAITLIMGITLGSASWWLFLSAGTSFIFHKRISSFTMQMINGISGIIILTFGFLALKIILI